MDVRRWIGQNDVDFLMVSKWIYSRLQKQRRERDSSDSEMRMKLVIYDQLVKRGWV